ncbi:MAG: hypothetical protein ABSA17_02185 [Rhabdochlamydiaceae bacterium]|jgi:exopolyphosphatase/guanosine-5'-triphosphate,3'-diphosphate pyrophosphatase
MTNYDTGLRIATAYLPVCSFYKPLAPVVGLVTGGDQTLRSFTEIHSTKTALNAAISTISLANTFFANPAVAMICSVYDIVDQTTILMEHLNEGEFKQAFERSMQIAISGLTLSMYFYGGAGLSIASSAFQIALAIYHAQHQITAENYIEASAHIAMAIGKTYNLANEVKALQTISYPQIERRAVIDVGSGSTKVCIADVDLRTNTVVKVIVQESHAVPYQASIEATQDRSFNSEVREKGISTFAKIKATCEAQGVQKITAVATEAFRQASNQANFVQEIREKVGFSVRVIPQKEEGVIAFYSTSTLKKEIPESNLIVWDIGTGSYQLTVNKDTVSMGTVGSVPFKEYLTGIVKARDPSTPSLHPFTREDYKKADAYARKLARESALPELKSQIRKQDGSVIGVGRLFTSSLAPVAKDSTLIKRSDLRAYIQGSFGKTKEQMNSPFSESDVSNAVKALGFMKALRIHAITPVESATTQGMLTYAPYWA